MTMPQSIAIIDYRLGNLGSLENAVRGLGCIPVVTNDKNEIRKADRIILPGVGTFGAGMSNLEKLQVLDTLEREVIVKKKPILGICLGLQLFAETGEENGVHKGFGWLPGTVRRLPATAVHIPHMGWNNLQLVSKSLLFSNISDDMDFYFVHSYFLDAADQSTILATCCHGIEFPAVIQKENIFATQFHPEKSHRNGLIFLYNFLNYKPDTIQGDSLVVVNNLLSNALSDDRLSRCTSR